MLAEIPMLVKGGPYNPYHSDDNYKQNDISRERNYKNQHVFDPNKIQRIANIGVSIDNEFNSKSNHKKKDNDKLKFYAKSRKYTKKKTKIKKKQNERNKHKNVKNSIISRK